jgi:hypothetical protein
MLPSSAGLHASSSGSEFCPIQGWLSDVSPPHLLPDQSDHSKSSFGQAKSDIENGTEQGPLECAPVSEASLNDETVMKSGSRFSHGGSTKQEQTASTYQGRK